MKVIGWLSCLDTSSTQRLRFLCSWSHSSTDAIWPFFFALLFQSIYFTSSSFHYSLFSSLSVLLQAVSLINFSWMYPLSLSPSSLSLSLSLLILFYSVCFRVSLSPSFSPCSCFVHWMVHCERNLVTTQTSLIFKKESPFSKRKSIIGNSWHKFISRRDVSSIWVYYLTSLEDMSPSRHPSPKLSEYKKKERKKAENRPEKSSFYRQPSGKQ